MTSRFLIYGLVDPRTDEVRYVGQSSCGLKRPKQHRMPSSMKFASHKTNWIRQLHTEGLDYQIRVLEEFASVRDMEFAEEFWIAQLKGMGCALTNLTNGGGGPRGRTMSVETRQKISAALSGRTGKSPSPEARAALASKNRGELSPWFGKKRSAESAVKLSRSHGGSAVRDSNGVLHLTQSAAARALGLSSSQVHRALLSQKPIHGITLSRVLET